jgi:hypothetical protein
VVPWASVISDFGQCLTSRRLARKSLEERSRSSVASAATAEPSIRVSANVGGCRLPRRVQFGEDSASRATRQCRMADAAWEAPPDDEPFPGRVFGDGLRWDSPLEDAWLAVELPFWLMVNSSPLEVTFEGWTAQVQIRGDHVELHADEYRDSKTSCVYLGPDPSKVDPSVIPDDAAVVVRKCKTVLRLPTRCLTDAIAAIGEDYWRARQAMAYFAALCAGHIPVVNEVIVRYRLATYDFFPFEVSPWDVPVWFVQTARGHVMVPLVPYRSWDHKPLVNGELMSLITPDDLAAGRTCPEPGEVELVDGLMLMERGDYAGAVRRVVTAMEVIVEIRLRVELERLHPSAEVERRLTASQNDFPGRLRQWAKLSGRELPDSLVGELEKTRALRHAIVHRGFRFPYRDRGTAHRAVDTTRWAYNFVEGRADLAQLRETHLALRSIGRFSPGMHFGTELTPDGVVVSFDDTAETDEPDDLGREVGAADTAGGSD